MKFTHKLIWLGLLIVVATSACSSPTPTPQPTVAPTPTIPPGMYVTKVVVNPAQPKQLQDVTFNVTFFNNTGTEQKYRWYVSIYRPDQINAFGQTSSDKEFIIPPGTVELTTINAWKLGPGQPCWDFTAQVNWLGPNGTKPTFNGLDGKPVTIPFTVCPAN